MVDKEYAPLSALCVRSLNDKLYEKRKAGALEIERVLKEYVLANQDQQIKRVLKILGDEFAASANANTKKGGLIGLAAAAIALGKESSMYVNDLVKPVLSCFRDQDSRVRYYSCEALYNIVKVTRGSVLPFFNEIFDNLSRLAADPDQNVKNGTELLDRLIKDIVTESSSFDLVSFIPLLRERIYTRNQFARQFIVSWIQTLDAVPDINMLVLLPEILDGLFQILGDPDQEIRKMCQNVLEEFLNGIRKCQGYVNFAGMANILIIHSQSEDDLLQFTAIVWLREFVKLAERKMLPFVSGILNAILPRLVSAEIDTKTRKSVKEAAKSLNKVLMELIDDVDDNPTPLAVGTPSDSQEGKPGEVTATDVSRKVTVTAKGEVTLTTQKDTETEPVDREKQTYNLTSYDVPVGSIQLDVLSVINVLCTLVKDTEFHTRIASLEWFKHLLLKVPNKTFRYMSQVFPVLVETLADKGQQDETVLSALESLAIITSHPVGESAIDIMEENCPKTGNSSVSGDSGNKTDSLNGDKNGVKSVTNKTVFSGIGTVTNRYFNTFMVELLELFKKDRALLELRGPFVIRHLCVLLSSEDIFRSFSEILVTEEDVKFACTMVQTLSTILLTSRELLDLRNKLKHLHTKESCQLFCCLYKSWSHSPVATIALCYLSQNYTHACRLLPEFGNLEITVDFLNEIDKLIQLIESPIFAYLRLQLLEAETSQDLIKSLYGLLMLLPQAEPFTLLRNRLNCIPHFQMAAFAQRAGESTPKDRRESVSTIDFDDLLRHFIRVQDQHSEMRYARRKYVAVRKSYS